MHRLFLGCNLWSILFLTATVVLGLAGSPHHVRVAIFASIFACLIQSGVVALFLGAAKLAKEHIGRFDMPLSLIDRINEIYHRLIPMAAIGTVWTAAVAIIGGAVDKGSAPLWIHRVLAIGVFAYLVSIIPFEFKLQRAMHEILADVEKLVPPAEKIPEAPSHPNYKPDRVVMDRTGRAKALLYIGLTLPAPYLGYSFIAGKDVSYLLVPTIIATVACLGASAHQFRAARRQGHPRSGGSGTA